MPWLLATIAERHAAGARCLTGVIYPRKLAEANDDHRALIAALDRRALDGALEIFARHNRRPAGSALDSGR